MVIFRRIGKRIIPILKKGATYNKQSLVKITKKAAAKSSNVAELKRVKAVAKANATWGAGRIHGSTGLKQLKKFKARQEKFEKSIWALKKGKIS